MAEIKIGTSGYSYTDWLGIVYPVGMKQYEFLGHYAGLFPTVELNYSYYTMPKAENLQKMLVDGGEKLTFSIKAHETITHKIDPSKWENEAKTFLTAIEPLQEAHRLEAVLFQFPPSFRYNPDNRKYLDKLLTYFKGVPMAVEFRHSEWYVTQVIEGMKKRNVPLVSLDMPDLPNLPPLMDVVTSDTAYIRFHGRNGESWWNGTNYTKYDYEYTGMEIQSWADRIERIAEQAKRILVYFNNHPQGKAARNAQTLDKLLRKMGVLD